MRALFHRASGSGPLALLLHPVGLDSTFWPLLPEALGRTHRVVAVDLAGHGQSPDVVRPGHMADHVADIAGLIDELGGPALIVGNSFGGMIGQNVALTHPDKVSALVLAAGPGATPAAAREAILDRGRVAEAGGMEAVVDATIERWFTPAFHGSAMVADVRRRLLANTPSNWAATWEALSEHDALGHLNALKIPVLVVAGEADAATPLEAKRALAAAIPGSRLTVLAGAPHMLQLEQPAAYTAAVTAFADSLA